MDNKPLLTTKDAEMLVLQALTTKLKEQMEGYNSPLDNLVKEAVLERSGEIKKIISGALTTVFSDKNFNKLVKEEFQRKVAKVMVGKLEGAVEKAVVAISQDQTIKAKMILAVENIIESNQHT